MSAFLALVLVFLTLTISYLLSTYRAFIRNLAEAKASNITYVLTPVYAFQTFWLLTHWLWLPCLHKLPHRWIYPWIDLVNPEWPWNLQFTPFQDLGVDTFMTVSPGANIVWTAEAAVIQQVTTRRNDFPKPTYLYKSVDLFGKNVVSAEGQMWRHHRKITSPPFTEKNNHLVWTESIHQAQSMLRSWVTEIGNGPQTVKKVADDTMRLSLHVISRAGFGIRLLWPGVEDSNGKDIGNERMEALDHGVMKKINFSGDHRLSYTDALGTLLHNLLWVMFVPGFLLKHLPFKTTKVSYTSFIEWGKYMEEMYQIKKAEVAAGKEQEGLDLMGALVKGAGITSQMEYQPSSLEKGNASSRQLLTDDEIIGNAFVFILAGHETTANAIHFSLLYLAMDITFQRRLQKDLDHIFQDKPISEWDYERDMPKLFGGLAGAVLNEVLRLVPPVVSIPKCTLEGQRQGIIVDGKKCLIFGGTRINLLSIATHRNPRNWPTGPPSDPANLIHPTSNTNNDLEEFKPERWLIESSHGKQAPNGRNSFNETARSSESDDLGVNTTSDTASAFFRPPKGAYIPFSDGYRACLGRRFAQVEVLAVLAVIFFGYSVELAVDKYASDDKVDEMDSSEKREVWMKAEAEARDLLRNGMGTMITLQMRKGSIPLRFVKRGKERFDFA